MIVYYQLPTLTLVCGFLALSLASDQPTQQLTWRTDGQLYSIELLSSLQRWSFQPKSDVDFAMKRM